MKMIQKAFIIMAMLFSGYALADTTAAAGSISGSASQSGAASQSANSQNINFNNPGFLQTKQSGKTTIETVATVYAPPIGVTAPCFVGYSGGVTVVGFGASLGGGIEDVGCTLRETSRLLYGIGQTEAAARVMCANADAARAMGPAVCPVAVQTLPAPMPPQAEVTRPLRPLASTSCYSDSIVAARMNAPVCR